MSQVVHMATRVWFTPVVISTLGFENYGFWAFLFAMLGLIGLQRSGFVSASVPLVALQLRDGEVGAVKRTLRATATLSAIVGALTVLVVTLQREAILDLVGVSPTHAPEAGRALVFTAIITAVSLTLGGFQSLLEAHSRFRRVKSIEIAAGTAEVSVAVVLLKSGLGLDALTAAYSLRLSLHVALCALAPATRGFRLACLPGYTTARGARSVLQSGLALQGIGFLHLGVGTLERVIASRALGLATCGVFEVSKKAINLVGNMVGSAFLPLIPAAAVADTVAGKRLLTERSLRWTGLLAGLPLVALAANPTALFVAWLGEAPPDIVLCARVMAVASLVHHLTGPCSSILRGSGRFGLEAQYAALWLILLPASIPFAHQHGAPGFIVAACSAQALSSSMLILRTSRRLGIPMPSCLRSVVAPLCVAAAATGFGDAMPTDLSNRLTAFLSFLTSAGVAGIAQLSLGSGLILLPEDRTDVTTIIRSLSRKMLGATRP